VVQTLRNYRLMCVNGLFHRGGSVCEICIDKRLQLPGVLHTCYRSSLPASATVAAMNYYHRVRRTYEASVDAFIALSSFARSKYVHAGLRLERIFVKPNFVTPDPGIGAGAGGYAIFVGRLSPEKGVMTLLDAWGLMAHRLRLVVVGDGPLADIVQTAAAMSDGRIAWLGHRQKDEVLDLIGDAKVLVFPSEWYETFGRVAVEAFAKGTPVVAANIGAVAELVEDGTAGLRFEPGSARDLASKVERIIDDPDQQAWRRRARAEYEAKYTADRNYEVLREIYRTAITRKCST
jgi:glycosyltransferase involved in cell wall biosynthesis